VLPFIPLPENYGFLRRDGLRYPSAQDVDGAIVGALRSLARDRPVWILGGSFTVAIPDSSRAYHCSVLISPSGDVVAQYRNLYLFDVDLGSDGGSFRKSDAIALGDQVVSAKTDFGILYMSIVYDLRYPEL
jgi:predicted amidohydrolase